MKVSEIQKKIAASGYCSLIRHGDNHDIWKNNKTGKEFQIPRHPSKELPKGTAYKILKDAGLK